MLNRIFYLFAILALVSGCASRQSDNQIEAIPAIVAEEPLAPIYAEQAVNLFQAANQNLDTPNKALELYQQALAVDSNMEPARFNMARLYYDNGQHEELLSMVESASEITPLSARIINLLATSFKTKGQFSQALYYYDQALAVDEFHLASLANKAILLDIYFHNPTEALPWYEKYQAQLLAQEQEDPRTKNWIADVKQRINRLSGN